MTRRNHDEDRLQAAVAELLDLYGWLWCHVPNGGHRRRVEAARLKGAGVKRGVPDVLVFEPWECSPRRGMGLALELKVGRNTTSKEQDDWLADLAARGWLTEACWTMGEVHAVLRCCRPLNGRRLK